MGVTPARPTPPPPEPTHRDTPDRRDAPWPIAPMKAVPGPLPTSSDWVFEPKWDGHRALVRLRPGGVDVISSTGKPRLDTWPWIAGLRECVDADGEVVLDGEVVAMDDAGRHRFEHVGDPTRAHALILFDVLRVGGEPVIARRWTERRAILVATVVPSGPFSITPVHDDGALLWDVVVAAGYEGVVAKRRDSAYLPGRRAPTWRKTKARHVQELVVGGWLPGSGRRGGTLGSLLLGVHEPDGRLRFVGAVGSGFDDRALDAAVARLAMAPSDACPFDPPPPRAIASRAVWSQPRFVVQVEFAEWTTGGQLRHPVYLGFRDDVDPSTVTSRP